MSQSLQDIEVVAVDDGSGQCSHPTDWTQRDPRVRPVFAEHAGIVEAPNRGLHLCRGEFVARMDADDRMHRNRLQRQVEYFESNPYLSVVSCLVETFAEDGVGEGMRIYQDWLNALVTHADITREIFIESPIMIGNDAAQRLVHWVATGNGLARRLRPVVAISPGG